MKHASHVIIKIYYTVKIPTGNSMMVDYSFLSVPSVSMNSLEVYFKVYNSDLIFICIYYNNIYTTFNV